MKRNTSFGPFYIFVLFFLCASCKKVLDRVPSDFLSEQQFYQNKTQLLSALAGVYDRLGDGSFYGETFWTKTNNTTDEGVSTNSSGTDVSVYNPLSSTFSAIALFSTTFQGVDRANYLLNYINVAQDVTEEERNIIRGEAIFLRAFYHFTAAQWYGNIPYRTQSPKVIDDQNIPFTPLAAVYDSVVQQMKLAALLLNNQRASTLNHSERVSRTAVEGMIARVYLHMAGFPVNKAGAYDSAIVYAEKVIASGEHKLHPDFKQVFINHSADAFDNVNRESMWEVAFSVVPGNQTISEGIATRMGPSVGSNPLTGQITGFVLASGRLYSSYAPGDLRRDWTISPFTYTLANQGSNPVEVPYPATTVYSRFAYKWRRQYEVVSPRLPGFSPQNFPILRYADVLLMKAEAENEVNGPSNAVGAINQVRRRGFGLPVTAANATVDLPQGISREALRDTIRVERMRELAFEALRRQDLKRWGILVSTVRLQGMEAQFGTQPGSPVALPIAPLPARLNYTYPAANISDRDVFLPIPNAELTNNRFAKQNPGY